VELQQKKKWVVEYQNGNKEVVLDDTTPQQTVYIYGCIDTVVQVARLPLQLPCRCRLVVLAAQRAPVQQTVYIYGCIGTVVAVQCSVAGPVIATPLPSCSSSRTGTWVRLTATLWLH
jgi:hypothetical protein